MGKGGCAAILAAGTLHAPPAVLHCSRVAPVFTAPDAGCQTCELVRTSAAAVSVSDAFLFRSLTCSPISIALCTCRSKT